MARGAGDASGSVAVVFAHEHSLPETSKTELHGLSLLEGTSSCYTYISVSVSPFLTSHFKLELTSLQAFFTGLATDTASRARFLLRSASLTGLRDGRASRWCLASRGEGSALALRAPRARLLFGEAVASIVSPCRRRMQKKKRKTETQERQ
jgi:hypothetical protein